MHGDVPQRGAKEVIEHLQKNNIPHVYMTNGGGTTEAAKASAMGKKLGVEICESQVFERMNGICTASEYTVPNKPIHDQISLLTIPLLTIL